MIKNVVLADGGFCRLSTVLELMPIGKSTWWEGVKDGRFPKGVKLGKNTTAWRNEEIRKLLESFQ